MDSVGLQAFTDVATHKIMFPGGEATREEELRWRSQRFRTSLRDPTKRFVVAVEETVLENGTPKNQIVGWARWTAISAVPEPEKSPEEKAKEMEEKMKSWPDAMDKEAYKKILAGFAKLDQQWLAGDDPTNYWGENTFLYPMSRSQADIVQCSTSLPYTPTISGKALDRS